MSKQHSTLSKGRNFTIESFDIVAVCGNKLECRFDNVVCCFDIVAGVDGALVITSKAYLRRCPRRRRSPRSPRYQRLNHCRASVVAAVRGTPTPRRSEFAVRRLPCSPRRATVPPTGRPARPSRRRLSRAQRPPRRGSGRSLLWTGSCCDVWTEAGHLPLIIQTQARQTLASPSPASCVYQPPLLKERGGKERKGRGRKWKWRDGIGNGYGRKRRRKGNILITLFKYWVDRNVWTADEKLRKVDSLFVSIQ